MPSKLDLAWENLFHTYNILDEIVLNGKCFISAAQIKALHYEPRLLTKFDNSGQLPRLFADNHLSILPVSSHDYVIAHHDIMGNPLIKHHINPLSV